MSDVITGTQARSMMGAAIGVGMIAVGVLLFEFYQGEPDTLDFFSSGALFLAALSLYGAGKNACKNTNSTES